MLYKYTYRECWPLDTVHLYFSFNALQFGTQNYSLTINPSSNMPHVSLHDTNNKLAFLLKRFKKYRFQGLKITEQGRQIFFSITEGWKKNWCKINCGISKSKLTRNPLFPTKMTCSKSKLLSGPWFSPSETDSVQRTPTLEHHEVPSSSLSR